MKKRCLDETDKRWKDYGGRGIGIDPEWMNFDNFLRDMGIAPDGLQIDRKDNDQGYNNANCKWASRIEQQNNMRTNRWIAFGGQRLTVSQWNRELGLGKGTLTARLRVMPLEEAMQAGALTYQKPRASASLIAVCKWCGFERVCSRGNDLFCASCRLDVKGVHYRISYARKHGVQPKHHMKLTLEDIDKFTGQTKDCPKCKKTKDVLEGFGLRRPFDPNRGRRYTMARPHCRICEGKEGYARALARKEELACK
jgi:hypothetical protein